MSSASVPVLIRQIRLEAEGIHSFELVAADGGHLPACDAGAHVDLDLPLPGRLRRSYSLYHGRDDEPGDPGHWTIAVQRDAESRGGSAWLHEAARVGQVLQASLPSNDFVLDESAAAHVLVAGGIGITPILSIAQRLAALKRPWQLHYSARTPRQMAFRQRLHALAAASGGELHLHFSAEAGRRMDLAAIARSLPAGGQLYACGPAPMLDALVAAAASVGIERGRCHIERFAAAQAPASDGGFSVELARDGRVLQVPPGRSVLDVLLDAGVDVAYSCMQGICGSCRVGVKAGQPDHRDECLGEQERAGGAVMMVCCSGARTPRLLLDL